MQDEAWHILATDRKSCTQQQARTSNGSHISPPTADHRKGDARIQTRRAREWSGRQGRQGQEPPQAIAIALEEAGSSKHESKRRNARNLRRTERKEATGRTAQQEREGKSHVGARRQRESTRAMGGRDARKTTARGRKAATTRARKHDGHIRQELYAKAKARHIEGRSKMTKRQLENALGLR
jgi:hypothetical protein